MARARRRRVPEPASVDNTKSDEATAALAATEGAAGSPDCASEAWVEVDRYEVVAETIATPTIDVLIEVPKFHARLAAGVGLPAKAQEDSVLIKAAVRSPVRMVEMNEQLVPNHEAEVWRELQRSARTDKLAEPPTRVGAGFQESLLKSRSKTQRKGLKLF